MLIGCIAALSALAAGLMGWGTDAFQSLAWLWVLPAAFLGSFLLLASLVFLVLLIACAVVDPDKPQEKDSKFYRVLTNLCIEAVLIFARVRVKTRGLEQTPKEGRFLLVCNHLHEADVAILLHYFRKSQLAFISKQENRDMFLVGKLMPKLMCQLINRENDREALRTIIKCIGLLKDDLVSVAVFPEGYIRPDRKFHQLRPGVFKIAQKAKVPIVVCTIRGTQHIVKNFLKLRPSDVALHLLEVLPADWVGARTTPQIAEYVHQLMAEDLGPDYRPEEETP